MSGAKERGKKLLEAVSSGKDDEATKLLKEKVDFTAVEKGDNAIHMAARRGSINIIKLMKKHGADLEQKNVGVTSYSDIFQNGNMALHYAAREGYMDMVRYLKQNGVNLNCQNNDGEMPLDLAVVSQPMDVIEDLIALGMDPNKQNKLTGQTPLHTAMVYGRQEAMEALLIGKAKSCKDKRNLKPEDVAKTRALRECLRMYGALLIAMRKGCIKAKGMKITPHDVAEPLKVDRVNVIIQSIDIPSEFPTSFYCRREKSENSTVSLKYSKEEHVFSDVFFIRVSDVSRDCAAKISLPLYLAPTKKEQMVKRFINSDKPDALVDEFVMKQNVNFCLLETKLVPETTCICIIYVRPRLEKNKVNNESKMVTSDIEKSFSLDITEGTFENNTVLSLQVFETGDEKFIEDIKEDTVAKTGNNGKTSPPIQNTSLVTDIFQINVDGEQPNKGIMVQFPITKGCEGEDDIVIVTADETKLDMDDQLEVIQATPQKVKCNLIFEVSHFCIYVAAPKEKMASAEDRIILQRQISSARDRRKPATMFAVVRQTEDLQHSLVVECVMSIKSQDRLAWWCNEDQLYEKQTPDESEAIMMMPGDTFTVDITGNASFEEKEDSIKRKIVFSRCRASNQPFMIALHPGIFNPEDGRADVIIRKEIDNGVLKEVARLPIKLHTPPPPPPPKAKSFAELMAYRPSSPEKAAYRSTKEFYGVADEKKENDNDTTKKKKDNETKKKKKDTDTKKKKKDKDTTKKKKGNDTTKTKKDVKKSAKK